MEPERLKEYSEKMHNIKMHLKALDSLAQQRQCKQIKEWSSITADRVRYALDTWTNPESVYKVSCLVRNIFDRFLTISHGRVPTLSYEFYEYFPVNKVLNYDDMNNKWQSKEGIVTTVDLNLRWSRGQVKDLAVLKLQQPKARRTETLLHEIVVGLMLNGMRDYLPCFMYVYGGFYCAYPGDDHMAQGEFEDICSGNDEKTINACMLAEYAHDSVGTFLTFCEQPSIDKETKTKALLMLFFALIKARARFGFLHGDLHANNIIVRRLATPAVFAFTYQGQELKIETEYVPVIIDYGRCQIEWNDDVLVPLYGDPIQQERAYCPIKGLPNRDYCYADNLVANGVDVPGWDPVRLLISLDDLSVFLPEVVNNINACFYNLDFDVLDDYPSASQDNEAKWQMQSLTTTEDDAENPDCMLGFMNELLLHNKVRVLCGLAELPPV